MMRFKVRFHVVFVLLLIYNVLVKAPIEFRSVQNLGKESISFRAMSVFGSMDPRRMGLAIGIVMVWLVRP